MSDCPRSRPPTIANSAGSSSSRRTVPLSGAYVTHRAAAFWKQTAEQKDSQQRLSTNILRLAALAAHTHGV